MNAHSCPNCRSIGPPRMVGEDVGYLALCTDTWHDPFAGLPLPERIATRARDIADQVEALGPVAGAMVSTASLPTHTDDETARLVEELRQLRIEVDAARVIVERRGRIIADMRATGSELLEARRAASAEVERLRGLLGETLGCFDAVTDAGATGWIDSATYARVQREAALS